MSKNLGGQKKTYKIFIYYNYDGNNIVLEIKYQLYFLVLNKEINDHKMCYSWNKKIPLTLLECRGNTAMFSICRKPGVGGNPVQCSVVLLKLSY